MFCIFQLEDNEQAGDTLIDSDESRNNLMVKLFWIQTKYVIAYILILKCNRCYLLRSY